MNHTEDFARVNARLDSIIVKLDTLTEHFMHPDDPDTPEELVSSFGGPGEPPQMPVQPENLELANPSPAINPGDSHEPQQ